MGLVVHRGKTEVIRLFGIDCPEKIKILEQGPSSIIRRWCSEKLSRLFRLEKPVIAGPRPVFCGQSIFGERN